MQEASLADLTSSARRTKGKNSDADIPPPLVGASTTIVRNKLYVFGGRRVPKRILESDLYELDLATLEWERLWPPRGSSKNTGNRSGSNAEVVEELNTGEGATADQAGPEPRYFHSADAYGESILFFGGMVYKPRSRTHSPAGSVSSRTSQNSRNSKSSRGSRSQQQPESGDESEVGFSVSSDLFVYNTVTRVWSFPTPARAQNSTQPSSPASSPLISTPTTATSQTGPSPRYAHLSCITNNCFIILGGQDMANRYLQEISVLDLDRMVWIETRKFDGNCGTYRSVAVSRPVTVHAAPEPLPSSPRKRGSSNSPEMTRSNSGRSTPIVKERSSSRRSSIDAANPTQLSYSAMPSRDSPEPIWLFSNFSFANVKRQLDMVSAPRSPNFACPVTHCSHLMSSGPSLPPGLRFPTGAIIGHHLVIAGTYLSNESSCFAIWSLDLSAQPRGGRLTWQKIDPGAITHNGASWNKAVFSGNQVIIIGDRDREIAADYDHRQNNFVHIAVVDLEAFGIYQPPLRLVAPVAQDFGLTCLATSAMNDFEIVCCDGSRLGCNRKMLEERFPWFATKLNEFRDKARTALTKLHAQAESNGSDISGSLQAISLNSPANISELRTSPRTLEMPESSPVVFAALQYFYTLSLCTPLQHQLNILIGLLFFSRAYDVPNLRALVVHALHSALGSQQGAHGAAQQIYEASTLVGATALQVRSLKYMMALATRGSTRRRPTEAQ